MRLLHRLYSEDGYHYIEVITGTGSSGAKFVFGEAGINGKRLWYDAYLPDVKNFAESILTFWGAAPTPPEDYFNRLGDEW